MSCHCTHYLHHLPAQLISYSSGGDGRGGGRGGGGSGGYGRGGRCKDNGGYNDGTNNYDAEVVMGDDKDDTRGDE